MSLGFHAHSLEESYEGLPTPPPPSPPSPPPPLPPTELFLDLRTSEVQEEERLKEHFLELAPKHEAEDFRRLSKSAPQASTETPSMEAYLTWTRKCLRSPLIYFPANDQALEAVRNFFIEEHDAIPNGVLSEADRVLYDEVKAEWDEYQNDCLETVKQQYTEDVIQGVGALSAACEFPLVAAVFMSHLFPERRDFMDFFADSLPYSLPFPAPADEAIRKTLFILSREDVERYAREARAAQAQVDNTNAKTAALAEANKAARAAKAAKAAVKYAKEEEEEEATGLDEELVPLRVKELRRVIKLGELKPAMDAVLAAFLTFDQTNKAPDVVRKVHRLAIRNRISELGELLKVHRIAHFEKIMGKMAYIPGVEGDEEVDNDPYNPDGKDRELKGDEDDIAIAEAGEVIAVHDDEEAESESEAVAVEHSAEAVEQVAEAVEDAEDEEQDAEDLEDAEDDRHPAYVVVKETTAGEQWEAKLLDEHDTPDGMELLSAAHWIAATLTRLFPDSWDNPEGSPPGASYKDRSGDLNFLGGPLKAAIRLLENVAMMDDRFPAYAGLVRRSETIFSLAKEDPSSNAWSAPTHIVHGLDTDPVWSGNVRHLLGQLLLAVKGSNLKHEGTMGELVALIEDPKSVFQENWNAARQSGHKKRVEMDGEFVRPHYRPLNRRRKLVPTKEPVARPVELTTVGQFPNHVPKVGKTLYLHQLMNIARLNSQVGRKEGLIICDEPGLGKTASAVACACQFAPASGDNFSVLIVCPVANYDDPWKDTIEAWTTYTSEHIRVWNEDSTTRQGVHNLRTKNWQIMSYGKLLSILRQRPAKQPTTQEKKDSLAAQQADKITFLAHNFDCIIFDEIHKFGMISGVGSKSPHGSQTHLAALELIAAARHRGKYGLLGLTGTPMVNSRSDIAHLATLMHAPPVMLAPSFWKKAKFRCMEPNEFGPELEVDGKRWRDRIPFRTRTTTDVLRRLKPEDVKPLHVYVDEFTNNEREKARFKSVMDVAYRNLAPVVKNDDDDTDDEAEEEEADTTEKKKMNKLQVLIPLRLVTSSISLSARRDEVKDAYFNFNKTVIPGTKVKLDELVSYNDINPADKDRKKKILERSKLFDALRVAHLNTEIRAGRVPTKFQKTLQVATDMVTGRYKQGLPGVPEWGDPSPAETLVGGLRKVLIFSNFNLVPDPLAKYLHREFSKVEGFSKMKVPGVYHGKATSDEKKAMLKAFKSEPATSNPFLLLNCPRIAPSFFLDTTPSLVHRVRACLLRVVDRGAHGVEGASLEVVASLLRLLSLASPVPLVASVGCRSELVDYTHAPGWRLLRGAARLGQSLLRQAGGKKSVSWRAEPTRAQR